jgi:hypothetical protein
MSLSLPEQRPDLVRLSFSAEEKSSMDTGKDRGTHA